LNEPASTFVPDYLCQFSMGGCFFWRFLGALLNPFLFVGLFLSPFLHLHLHLPLSVASTLTNHHARATQQKAVLTITRAIMDWRVGIFLVSASIGVLVHQIPLDIKFLSN